MTEKDYPQCARCSTRICENRGVKMSDGPPSMKKLPGFCPMKLMPEVFPQAAAEYNNSAVREFVRQGGLYDEMIKRPGASHALATGFTIAIALRMVLVCMLVRFA